ncbi:sigma-54-dependent transcriptional regulator [Psychroflexus montanilacus]|uniref:sigma-54-dependent transcriptional regulator n=1 Tax=Psychroflexus montanilacus TaxID=2873598 RepID=UPI001CCAE269|nr:sigma-54 dependent transcriptional regulator [Psychroflexus montanilacus]MBZ9650435.1 sigma-54 dependent transcriptional regulator [Psychroflexus montanilacus]
MSKLLIVDDDPFFNKTLSNYLRRFDYNIDTATSAEEAIELLKEFTFDLVITDYRLPNMDGLQLVEKIKTEWNSPVILITNYSDIRTAVKSIKLGAFEFVSKPIIPEEFKIVIEKALDTPNTKTTTTNKNKTKASSDSSLSIVKGNTEKATELWSYAKQVAPTQMSVLITGESGTGKEYVAKYIHENSKRKDKPFVAIDCGALPESIASSELFGHVKGAFTGADRDKKGQFEYANGGTLFLDEIGNLSYESQVKLLRVLQERKIRRVGGNQEIDIDVRIIAATNENLDSAIAENEFRNDLYHRLNEFSLNIPSLKDRQEDLKEFVDYFIQEACEELDKEKVSIDNQVLEDLKSYDWPGNLRELKNLMKRAALLCQNGTIEHKHLPPSIFEKQEKEAKQVINSNDLKEVKEHHEREIILKCLEKNKFNKSKTAKELNIDRTTLYNKIKSLGLDV